ncbi:hypothetical protein BO70DRAFT_365275 [Aspergillus heteromorphus CBS 117.55]|uniref:Uncharacterized protein n=1 Tax=Aspergillus heteromorphus CBS 117.55 TaxID=1448321 RepID=A0A317VA61_9EURO|nr:uncharacterized protein BO70DRAFT_365275 [Aspergillus heteromorphus CBS 117.55]PWY70965.1 hypothetical protein BO70DRAFT_365275 [Aspergillus heteromorphus CBS 117.55]
MDVPPETVDKVRRFAEKRQRAEGFYETQTISPATLQAYNRKLDDTLRDLQNQVKRQEDDLRTVCISPSLQTPHPAPTDKPRTQILTLQAQLREVNTFDLSKIGSNTWSRVAQVRRAKKAYESLLKSETQFPAPGSPLPSLVAIEETMRLVQESKVSIAMTAEKLSSNRQRLKAEEANLRDAHSIRDGLRRRIQTLGSEKASKEKKTAAQLARELVDQQTTKQEDLDSSTEEMKTALYKFVDDSLASMLAAEALGGPTVGDAPWVSDATLQLGYTNHGKPKKPRAAQPAADPDTSQRRIDELLPPRQSQSGQGNNDQASNRREAAGLEMRNLLDKLLEASSSSSYIDLPRESAASRFLVRAKVAQFHPRDARKLRLIDFGRSLDD